MQLIIITESRGALKTDYQYVKSAIDFFYVDRQAQLTKINAKNNSELIKQDLTIKDKRNGRSDPYYVIIVADVDINDGEQNKTIEEYCKNRNYDLIWMNTNIEDVFLGKMVPDSEKEKEVNKFLRSKEKIMSSLNLSEVNPQKIKHSSNLRIVFDKYLTKKSDNDNN